MIKDVKIENIQKDLFTISEQCVKIVGNLEHESDMSDNDMLLAHKYINNIKTMLTNLDYYITRMEKITNETVPTN